MKDRAKWKEAVKNPEEHTSFNADIFGNGSDSSMAEDAIIELAYGKKRSKEEMEKMMEILIKH